ncbi:hypothetical protein C5167_050489 [Papaver somniferum]|uniref:Thioredoxin domain-containing protein n=1 Tax=Papaver somniferum TaxID=3469 RepID=A0A4Y7KRN1_PAPSO|nr:hypothetical protein C5167_050489 [Papaver somniferum]
MLYLKRNPNSTPDLHFSWRFLLITLFLILFASPGYGLLEDSGRNQSLQWQVLTKMNFSSQIRLHPHILLLITVPWSGESRALMKEVAHLVASKPMNFGSLELMVMYRNTEKVLADALGATERTSIIVYQHSVSYKYQGRLRAQSILHSVSHLMSLQQEDIPLELLSTPEDLTSFSESTDKAVFLFEFCGWTLMLLNKGKHNRSGNAFGQDISDNDIFFGENVDGKTNRTLSSSWKKSEKFDGMGNEKLTCGMESGLSGTPWLGDLSFTNKTAPSEAVNTRLDLGVSCTLEEFQRYGLFFSQLKTAAREFFLPPEKQRFALISERSLLSSLGVEDPRSWLVMLNYAGCPNCSKILKDEDDVKNELQMHQSFVTELEGEGHDTDPGLPANKPSIILSIDRSSESPETRRKSKEALDVFRKLAVNNSATHKFSALASQGKKGMGTSNPSDHSATISSLVTQVDNLKKKVSVMIINEGGTATLDDISVGEQSKSIQKILKYLLQQEKEANLSLLAEKVGFQLLSEDLNVDVANMLPSQIENNQSEESHEPPTEAISEISLNLDDGSSVTDAIRSAEDLKNKPGVTESEVSTHTYEKKIILKNTDLSPLLPKQGVVSDTPGVTEDMIEEGQSSSQVDDMKKHQIIPFTGLFYFSDGDCQLPRSLTGETKVPSLVILDPVSQQHYVYPEEASFSYSSLVYFLDGFLNRTLPPYQRSESVLKASREAARPPFINLDFHEADSIPRVTANKFFEMVLGFNHTDTDNVSLAWKKDVLVLFSNSWCAFCQRMELVVREVSRAFENYMKMLKSETSNHGSIIDENREEVATYELPLVYLMDCTLNDCSSLLKPMGQRELYPALILFPALRKTAVSYQGDASVADIIQFVADHGSNSHHLSRDKGFIWTQGQELGTNQVPSLDLSSIHNIGLMENSESHEVLLNNRIPARNIELSQSVGSHPSVELHSGTILISTDKLLNASPFEQSKILIVQADQLTGFLGLIINKHINWDSLQGLETGFDLVKQAQLSFGGPLVAPEMPLVSLSRKSAPPNEVGYKEIFPSVYFLNHLATLREIEGLKVGNLSTSDCWFFLGYSSWGWDQLFNEIAEGAWYTSDDPVGEFKWPDSLPTLNVEVDTQV